MIKVGKYYLLENILFRSQESINEHEGNTEVNLDALGDPHSCGK
jgi:hypothetical protein